jgi:hypothetical protein
MIVVAALVFLLLGVGLTLLGVFCVAMLKMMRQMQEAAAVVSKTVTDASKELNVLRDGRWLAAISDIHRLVEALPNMLAGLSEFNKLWGTIGKNILSPDVPRASMQETPPTSDGEEGRVYTYSEETAAANEATEELRRNKLVMSDEQMAGMRTDSV